MSNPVKDIQPTEIARTMSEIRRRPDPSGVSVPMLFLLGSSAMLAAVFALLWSNTLTDLAQARESDAAARKELADIKSARQQSASPAPARTPEPAAQPVPQNNLSPLARGTLTPYRNLNLPKGFEPSNLNMQHAVAVEISPGKFQKVLLDMPVLIKSGQIRWSTQQIERAKQLSSEIAAWRDKSGELQAEGQDLLRSWDELVLESLPLQFIQPDSSSLPTNRKLTSGDDLVKAAQDPVESAN